MAELRALTRWVAGTTLFAVALVHADAAALSAARRQSEDNALVFTLPIRRAVTAVPAQPPPLPARADNVPPLTLQVDIRREGTTARPALRLQQAIARTRNRIHLRVEGTEWLFERNPVDARRVSGQQVDHGARTIITHEESDLRNRLNVRGWADVLTLGVDPGVLTQLAPTPLTRRTADVTFRKYETADATPMLTEVWWSEALALASQFVVRDASGSTRVHVTRIQRGVDPALLDPPASRFPHYEVVDLAQWLEEH